MIEAAKWLKQTQGILERTTREVNELGNVVTYNTIYSEILAKQQQIRQWKSFGDLARALEYQQQAIALVELLEVHNCGSIGGFDRGQPPSSSLDARIKWLKKYMTKEVF